MNNYLDMLGYNMIQSVSMEIGGGSGWWCQECGKLYHQQPLVGYVCNNVYKKTQIDRDKLVGIIHQLGEISDEIVQQYIDDPTHEFKEIDQIYKQEKQCLTEEEATYEITYLNLMELVLERYRSEIYIDIQMVCTSGNFKYETRRGQVVDQYDGKFMTIQNNIKTSQWVPLQFRFTRGVAMPVLPNYRHKKHMRKGKNKQIMVSNHPKII